MGKAEGLGKDWHGHVTAVTVAPEFRRLGLAAKLMGIKAYVVMPQGTPKVKREAVLGYGAEVTDCAPNLAAREQATQEIIQRTGATALHPSNAMPVILGNATATMELLEEVPDLNGVIAPVGGGGLVIDWCQEPLLVVIVAGCER